MVETPDEREARFDRIFENARREMLAEQRECAWCNKQFDSSDALIQHIKSTHTNGR